MVERKASRAARGLRSAIGALALAGLSTAALAQAGSEGPFKGLSGAWTGTGTVSVSSGSSERIRCRATYSVTPSGTTLRQELRCASDSYKFQVSSTAIADSDGSLKGTWTETTRQVSGAISGTITPGSISISVNGTAFSASLSVQTSGNQQTVSIRPQGTDITSVQIAMKRG